MTGFPEVAGSLKLGTGLKDDGKTAPNLAIFAELPYEADLFSGVVLKTRRPGTWFEQSTGGYR